MSAYIKYGDFVFQTPEPLVSKTEEMIDHGGKWVVVQNISIEGQLTGLSQNEIYSGRYSLITGLSKSYKEFLVIEDTSGNFPRTTNNGKNDAHGNLDRHYWPAKDAAGNMQGPIWTGDSYSPWGADVVVSGAFTRVDSVDFDSSNYFSDGGVINYSVSLSCYNPETFNDAFRVLDPVDEIDFSETEENIVEISHKVSAKGINAHFEDYGNTGNALYKAKAWVSTRTGSQYFAVLSPALISGRNISNAVLISQSENINRMAGTYSVDEKWQYNPSGNPTTKSFQKYSFDISSGATSEYASVSTSLDIRGGLDVSLNDLRNEVPSVDTVRYVTTGETSLTGLSYFPNSYKVKEDQDAKTINISVEFDTNTGDYDPNPAGVGNKPYFDYEVSLEEDSITNTSKISINGELKLRKNQLYTWSYFTSYFDSIITNEYLYKLATGHFADFNNGNHPLNPNPESISVTEKSGVPSISVNISFSDKDWITGYKDAEWNISETPSIAQFRPKASAIHNGEWIVPYLGYYNREKIGFSYNFVPEQAAGVPANQIGYSEHYAVQWNPMRYVTKLRNIITGAGYRHFNYNRADTFFHSLQGNLFHNVGPIGDRLTRQDKYGVRLKKEDFSVVSGSNQNTMSYDYEYTKPANTNISIKIP
jgi:hypothetical protein